MFPDNFFDEPPIIALISGRFLPVEELELTRDVDTTPLHGVGGTTSGVAVASEQWSISFTTRRDPMLQPPMMADGYIFNQTHRIRLSDAISTSGGLTADEWDGLYEVEMVLESWEVEPR